MLETCRRLKRLCRNVQTISHDMVKLQLSQHFCRATKIFCRATWVSCSIGVTLCCGFYTFRSWNTCTFGLTTHDLLKSRISNLVHNAFRKKDGSVRYTHIKVTRAKGYFTHDINGGGDNMYTADNICKMIEFLIDNIFVQFGGRLFRQVIGIPMGTNCPPLLADLFLYSCENEFLDNMIRSSQRRLAR